LVRVTGAPTLNAEQMTITDATAASIGRVRNPLPMTTGQVVVSHTSRTNVETGSVSLRLREMEIDTDGKLIPGAALTPGITKSITWWDPDNQASFNGELWEIEPVEVVARQRPPAPTSQLASAERAVLESEQVDETA